MHPLVGRGDRAEAEDEEVEDVEVEVGEHEEEPIAPRPPAKNARMVRAPFGTTMLFTKSSAHWGPG